MDIWRNVTAVDLDQIGVARAALHRAIQIIAAVGRTFCPKVKDDHYASLFWLPEQEMLIGHPIHGKFELKAGLRIKDFSLHLLDADHQIIASFELNHKTQGSAMVWLEEQLAVAGLAVKSFTLQLPYEIPEYPPVKGKPFLVDVPEALAEISSYFHNAYYLFNSISKRHLDTSPIETWPHHFDMAFLIILNDTGEPETSTTIGVGFCPGDLQIAEPYFYINTWPYPPTDALGDAPGLGYWNTENWVGAILKSSALLKGTITQQHQIEKFFNAGIGKFYDLLKDT